MNLRKILTDDGSSSIFVDDLNETYHSQNGAITESLHVFIDKGLNHVKKDTTAIFEVGFGTGLNALLSAIWAAHNNRIIKYHSIENFPLSGALIDTLNYASLCNNSDSALFSKIHAATWDTETGITSHFALKKIKADLLNFRTNERYDLIFFDAFAPDKQSDLWNVDVFGNMFNILNNNGILVTYCAKGEVRRIMQHCGFLVERLPGPPGKREMLRGSKKVER